MTDQKNARREEAKAKKICTECRRRKARKDRFSCGPCSKAAGERRDALEANRKAEAQKATNKRKTRTTSTVRASAKRTGSTARGKAKAKA